MSAVIPFEFEGASVRVVQIGDEPWMVGKDAATVLGYVNPADALSTHCKGVAKRYPLPTAGGVQEVRLISEPDLYRLIAHSALPAAERFEKWLFEEVLPTIRKTGGYTAPTGPRASERYREAAAIGHASMKLCKLMGVETNMARVITADLVKKESGVDCSPMLGSNIAVDEKPMTPTELGKHIEISAKRVNALLIEAGLQTKTLDGYEITEAGKAVGCTEPFKSPNSAHVGHRPMWFQRALDPIRALLPDNVVSMTGSGS